MALTPLNQRTLKLVGDEGNPNKVPAFCQTIGFGKLVNATLRVYRGQAVSNRLVLPKHAKAAHLVRARVNSGANAGEKTIAAPESTPGANAAAIAPNGDILFAAAASDPLVEVMYFAHASDEREATVSVVSNAGAIPFGLGGLLLTRVNVTGGTGLGVKTIVARGTAPAAGQAALSQDGESVAFNAADAVTRAELTFVALPGAGNEPKSPASKMQDLANL